MVKNGENMWWANQKTKTNTQNLLQTKKDKENFKKTCPWNLTSYHALLSLTYSYYLISNKIQSIKSFHTIKRKAWFYKVRIFWEGHKLCEISTVNLSYVVTIKSTVDISQNFVAFSEYKNFIIPEVLPPCGISYITCIFK